MLLYNFRMMHFSDTDDKYSLFLFYLMFQSWQVIRGEVEGKERSWPDSVAHRTVSTKYIRGQNFSNAKGCAFEQ